MTYDTAAAAAGPPTPERPTAVSGPEEVLSRSSSAVSGGPGARPEAREPIGLPPEVMGAAHTLFGDRLPLAATYAAMLATDGVVRGLIGPREAPRIWERHLLNCAAVAELVPSGSSVIDVGSGAGLPGLVLAVARPDLSVVLVEPLARRTAFLTEVVTELGLDRSVTVVRGRAEQFAGIPGSDALPPADVVTARAVAPLDRLVAWCLPLARLGGRILALKGASVAAELAEHRDAVGRVGGGPPVVRLCGVGLIDPPTTVVEIVRESGVRDRTTKRNRPPAGADGQRGSAVREAGGGRTRRRG